MKNIVKVLTVFCFMGLSTQLHAQAPADRPSVEVQARRDSLKASKVAELKKFREDLFVERLKLTDAEKAKFFAVYDEYQLKLKEQKMAFRKKWEAKKPGELTEQEAEQYFNEAIALRKQEVDLFQIYGKRLQPIVGMNRVIQLPKIEREIKKELISKAKSLRKKKGNGGGNGGNGNGSSGGEGGGRRRGSGGAGNAASGSGAQ